MDVIRTWTKSQPWVAAIQNIGQRHAHEPHDTRVRSGEICTGPCHAAPRHLGTPLAAAPGLTNHRRPFSLEPPPDPSLRLTYHNGPPVPACVFPTGTLPVIFMELPSDSPGLKTSFAISIKQQELEAITNEATSSSSVDPLPGLAQAFPTIFETRAARTDGLSSPSKFSTMASVRRRSRRLFGQPSAAPCTDLKRRDSATLPSFDYSHRRARKFR
ncbi:hypothetical protein KC347_g260 [Hortaea werneckii]|nr:hypothetical protein KC347_g260 [Hortaea werneckii]